MKLGQRTRRFLLYPLLLAGGCHTLLTGSPIPMWDIEKLKLPVAVKAIEPDRLILDGGHIVRLPLVKRLPAEDPLMLAAVKNGVEITAEGDVFGLLWVDQICGNDPYHWIRRRVNLALLAAILVPDNFDESQTPADVLAQVREEDRMFADQTRPRRYDRGHINVYDLGRMARIRKVLDHPWKPAKEEERWRFTVPVTGLSEE